MPISRKYYTCRRTTLTSRDARGSEADSAENGHRDYARREQDHSGGDVEGSLIGVLDGPVFCGCGALFEIDVCDSGFRCFESLAG